MKRAILIAALSAMVGYGATPARAVEEPLTILLVGSPEADRIAISLSADGRTYTIDSAMPLEVGGNICWHPGGNTLELLCEAPPIAAFEVNAGGGDDVVQLTDNVLVAVTARGAPGDDVLTGGGGDDALLGGPGDDRLTGESGDDKLDGGGGKDLLYGGSGKDVVLGGAGDDTLFGAPGRDIVAGGAGSDALLGGPGDDTLNGGEGSDTDYGGPGDDRFIGGAGDKVLGGPGRDVLLPGNEPIP